MEKYYLAVDLGASGGRLMLGSLQSGKIKLEEMHRFSNGAVLKNGQLCWEYDRLFEEILQGMRLCADAGKIPVSMGVDSWGVDFVLLDAQGQAIGSPVAYRDKRTAGADDAISKIIDDRALYARTGTQKQVFNTIYQLHTVREDMSRAARMLMAPEYFHYLLTGQMRNEYTNASTTGLLDAAAKDWDFELIERLGYPKNIFGDLRHPGDEVGLLSAKVANRVGFSCRVVLPPTHDTASAVAAAPITGNAAYISSGTWSLMGMELDSPVTSEESRAANFTNEGGVNGTIRYLKNIMGMWMLQELRRELGGVHSYIQLEEMAESADDFSSVVDVSDGRFLAPESMSAEVKAACAETGQAIPQTVSELSRCIHHSLAVGYRQTAQELAALTGRRPSQICIVGGGSRNGYLNRLTTQETGLAVLAGPAEATALGNLSVQMIADGAISNIAEAREIIKNSFEIISQTK